MSARRVHVLLASVPLLIQLFIGPNLHAQNSGDGAAIGPRPYRVASPRRDTTNIDSLRAGADPASPRDARCIVRDFGIGVLAAGAAVFLVTFALAPLAGGFGGEEDLRRAQRRALYWGLGLGTAYTLLRLREPCDLTDNLLPITPKK